MTHLRHTLSTAGLVASLLAVGFTTPALAGSHGAKETAEDTVTSEVMTEADELMADEPTIEADEFVADEPTAEADEFVADEPATEADELMADEPATEADEFVADEPTAEADELMADEPMTETEMVAETGDIVDVAVEAGTFNTLATALEAAGLVDVLKGDGPFTVFAPTDEAFAALPEGVLEALLAPENQDQLVSILTYHVVPDAVLSTSLEAGEIETVEGSTVSVDLDEAGVSVNGAQVVLADIEASNGVIHVVDQVILPEEITNDLALLVTEEAPEEAVQY